MTQNDFEQFKAGMIALAAVTGKTLDIVTERAYWSALEDIPGPVVASALKEAMTRCEWFPSAAELRTLCDLAEHEQERLALAAVPERLALPDPDAQVRRDEWQPPEPTYHCWKCKDSGKTHYVKKGATWATPCECIKEAEDSMKNPVIMARIYRLREILGLTASKYTRSKPKGERQYGRR